MQRRSRKGGIGLREVETVEQVEATSAALDLLRASTIEPKGKRERVTGFREGPGLDVSSSSRAPKLWSRPRSPSLATATMATNPRTSNLGLDLAGRWHGPPLPALSSISLISLPGPLWQEGRMCVVIYITVKEAEAEDRAWERP